MRTLTALVAATFCALALSGPTMARDLSMPTANPGWLEFRAAFAAEDLWPKTVGVRKSELVKAPVGKREDEDGTLAAERKVEVQRVFDAIRKWEATAKVMLKDFDIAGN